MTDFGPKGRQKVGENISGEQTEDIVSVEVRFSGDSGYTGDLRRVHYSYKETPRQSGIPFPP